jgi:hypothetical protein
LGVLKKRGYRKKGYGKEVLFTNEIWAAFRRPEIENSGRLL